MNERRDKSWGRRADELARLAADPLLYVRQAIRHKLWETLEEPGGIERVLQRINVAIAAGEFGQAYALAAAMQEHKDYLARSAMTRRAMDPLVKEIKPSSTTPPDSRSNRASTPAAGASSKANTASGQRPTPTAASSARPNTQQTHSKQQQPPSNSGTRSW